MIRFVDLRGADTGYKFAFWDTCTDRFINIGNDQAWDSVADLNESAEIARQIDLMPRLKGLCPKWIDID